MVNLLANEEFITYIAIPLLILIARITDVTLGTIRMIFINKGEKLLSAVLGFFEVIIWLLAITRIMGNLTNIYAYIAYATGFAAGTYMGVLIEQRLRIGKVMVRIITSKDAKKLVKELRKKRYTFTCIGVDGPDGEVQSLQVVINKKDLDQLIKFILSHDKNSFYTVEDVRIVSDRNISPLIEDKVPRKTK